MWQKRLFESCGALLFSIFFFLGQTAWADAGNESYFMGTCLDSPRVIPAAAFRGANREGADAYAIAQGFAAGVAGKARGCIVAPVYLPAGAKINEMYAYLYDNSAADNVVLNFVRTRIEGHEAASETLYTFETGVESPKIQTLGGYLKPPVAVRYPGDQFYLETCLGDENTRVYSVRIYFE